MMSHQDLHVSDGGHIISADLAQKRCGNCKHQGTIKEFIEPDSGKSQMLCLAHPPTATPLYTFVLNPQGFRGNVVKNAGYPPAPDHWTCGEWRPRFEDPSGARIR
jgi:hypothetical protein